MFRSKVTRLLDVWLEREVYDVEFIQQMKSITKQISAQQSFPVAGNAVISNPPSKAVGVSSSVSAVQTVKSNVFVELNVF